MVAAMIKHNQCLNLKKCEIGVQWKETRLVKPN